MNGFDFSQPGKFPITQENLDWMQQSVKEALRCFAYDGGSYNWVIVGGVNQDPITFDWSDGWVFIDGEILPLVGGAGTRFEIVENKTGVLFEGGITKNVKVTRYVQVGTTGLLVGTLKRWESILGQRALQEAGVTDSVVLSNAGGSSGGNINGTLNTRRNVLTRTLHLDGVLTVSSAQTITDPGGTIVTLATLPPVDRPAKKTPFFIPMVPLYKDASATFLLTGMYAEVDTNGDVKVHVLKPQTAVTSYILEFNQIISLD